MLDLIRRQTVAATRGNERDALKADFRRAGLEVPDSIVGSFARQEGHHFHTVGRHVHIDGRIGLGKGLLRQPDVAGAVRALRYAIERKIMEEALFVEKERAPRLRSKGRSASLPCVESGHPRERHKRTGSEGPTSRDLAVERETQADTERGLC
jgi:hypothetical protein